MNAGGPTTSFIGYRQWRTNWSGKVAVIIAVAGAVFAAKAATATIPIIFIAGEDPVRLGLVASLARPGGNLTGINQYNEELAAKRLELLRELVPGVPRVAVLLDPTFAATETTLRDLEAAARAIGMQIPVFNVSTSREVNAAFASFVRDRPDALFVGIGPFFTSRRVQLAILAARHLVPMTCGARAIAEAGALMSYGSDVLDARRQVGVYAGRILKGAKRPTCRSCRRQSSSWSSTSRPQGHSTSRCRQHYSPAPTR